MPWEELDPHKCTCAYIYIYVPESYSFVHLLAFSRVIRLSTILSKFHFPAARRKLRVISLATGELLVCPLFGSIFDPKRWTN